jgi:hypothetical protein
MPPLVQHLYLVEIFTLQLIHDQAKRKIGLTLVMANGHGSSVLMTHTLLCMVNQPSETAEIGQLHFLHIDLKSSK